MREKLSDTLKVSDSDGQNLAARRRLSAQANREIVAPERGFEINQQLAVCLNKSLQIRRDGEMKSVNLNGIGGLA